MREPIQKTITPKINSLSVCAMFIFLTGCSYFGIATSYILNVSKTTTLISMVIGFFIGLIYLVVILKFYNILITENISSKFKILFKKFSIIINIIYMLVCLLIITVLSYRLSSFLSSQYLIETKVIYLNAIVLFSIFYIANKRIETLSRLCILSSYIVLIMLMVNFSSLYQYIDYNNFLPILNIKISDLLKSSFIFSLYFSIPAMYINVINKDNIVDSERLNKRLIISYIISFIFIFLVIFTTIGVLGIDLCNIFNYPTYTVLKEIKIFYFLDSIENFSIIVWILFIIISASIVLLNLINAFNETFNIKEKYKKYLYILLYLLVLIVPNIIFEKNTIIENLKYIYIPLSANGILFIIQIISLMLNKKNVTNVTLK